MLKHKLKAARQAAGLTQEQLADKSGVSLSSIKAFERGGTPCPASHEALKLVLPALPALGEAPAPPKRDSSSDEWDIDLVLGDGTGKAYAVKIRRIR